jgi:GMP synthase (glutamine-hydrolysing)
VWQADGEPLPGAGYGHNIALRLGRLGCDVAVVDYRARPLSETERAAPVHVLSGGETSAHAGDPATSRALADLDRLAGRAAAGQTTVIGICLGAQLLARVLAPELPRSTPPAGLEAGWCTVAGPHGHSSVAQLHYEQLHPGLARRAGIEVTHGNAHSEIQAFRWGSSMVGMQFHPEWSPADTSAVLDRHTHLLAEHDLDVGSALASVAQATHRWRPRAFERLVVEPVLERLATAAPGVPA